MATDAAIAERIAESIWIFLGKAWDLKVRLGEETLTDFLILKFMSLSSSYNIQFYPTNKIKETTQGTDLIVYVRQNATRADIYAIQAKKINATGRYDNLSYRTGKQKTLQIDVLEKYAMREKALPFYLLYNHVDSQYAHPKYWHCGKSIDKMQFGCTLVPSWCIRDVMVGKTGRRTFPHIHSNRNALPWRCAFDCPKYSHPWNAIREMAKISYHERFHGGQLGHRGFDSGILKDINFKHNLGEWPADLWERGTSLLSTKDAERFSFKESQLGLVSEIGDKPHSDRLIIPRWVMLMDVDEANR